MVDAVGLNGGGGSLGAIRAVQASAPMENASTTEGSAVSTQPLSPSMRSDPTTGILITEYFSSSGQVRMQIPSQAAIAYMRSGMAAKAESAEKAASAKNSAQAAPEAGSPLLA